MGSVFSQDSEETIPWSAERKLKWSDFKGSYLKTQWAAATTATAISYNFSSFEKDGQQYLDIEVHCDFLPERSWYRPDAVDSLTLVHEQLHFDIVELHGRKMRKRLAETRFTKDIKEEVKAIYLDILKQLRQVQKKYDQETNFSRDIVKQLVWNKKIANTLRGKEKKLLP